MHSEYGVVLDYFYICEIGLDCSIQRFEAFGLTFYYGGDKQSSKGAFIYDIRSSCI